MVMNPTVSRMFSTCVTWLALSFCVSVFAADKPNILIIWGDDISNFNLSAYNRGMMGYKTPNIDRIADEGTSSPWWKSGENRDLPSPHGRGSVQCRRSRP